MSLLQIALISTDTEIWLKFLRGYVNLVFGDALMSLIESN